MLQWPCEFGHSCQLVRRGWGLNPREVREHPLRFLRPLQSTTLPPRHGVLTAGLKCPAVLLFLGVGFGLGGEGHPRSYRSIQNRQIAHSLLNR